MMNGEHASMQAYREERDRQALMAIMNTVLGSWFISRLLDSTGLINPSFTGNSQTFYKEGKRAVGIGILNQIKALGLEGMQLKHTAELEYANKQIEWATAINQRKEDD